MLDSAAEKVDVKNIPYDNPPASAEEEPFVDPKVASKEWGLVVQ